jgi:subtilase family serine protease
MHSFLKFHAVVRPFASQPSSTAYSPAEIQTAYGFNNISFASYSAGGSLPLPGAGQTIAIVDAYDDPNIATDLATFDKAYNLPSPPNLIRMNQNGSTSSFPRRDYSGGWEMEESLDVEWAHAIAPGASILLVEANSSYTSDLLTAVRTAANYSGPAGPVSVVSMSWGGGEFSGESSSDSSFTTPSGHAPIAFVVSSGDNGAPPSWPAASPNVLAVGGTTLKLGANNSWGSESGWSGSGGGLSSNESQPSYQAGVVTQSTTARTNPDVAYDADPNPGFSIYDSIAYYGTRYNWTAVGGTSAGAPQWAALIAIADQGRALSSSSLPRLTTTPAQAGGTALAQSVLYNLYYTTGYASTYFHDISSGTSTGSPNYAATANYDLVTGLGTPHADQIVGALVSPPPTSGFGAPTNLTATPDNAGPIALSWTAVPGAVEYDVYATDATGASSTLLFTTTANAAENTGVVPGQIYYYEVLAKNAAGTSSGFSNVASATATTNTLFTDAFNGKTATSNWTQVGASGAWQFNETGTDTSTTSGGANVPIPANGLSQTNYATAADPQKAVVTAQGTLAGSSTASQMITAQFEVTNWATGEYARAGVGLDTNSTATGSNPWQAAGTGYSLAIRDRNGGQHNTLQFLDDGVTWGNQYAFNLQLNTWYNIQMESRGGVLYANVWAVGTAEPPTWQYVQAGWGDRTGGYAALNGSSEGVFPNESFSGATSAFRNVTVTGG